MPWFECFIEGADFPGALIGETGLVGFCVTRWVEASSTDEAQIVALDLLRSEPRVQIETAAKTPDARVYFTEITEVDEPGDNNIGVA